MSVVFSLLMLLLLLGFSSHACGGVVDDHHQIKKDIDEKSNSEARVSISPMPSDDATRGVGDRTVENESDDHHLDDHGMKEASGTTEWRVPHRKKGEVEPVFNLDYLPPKTHPPSHN